MVARKALRTLACVVALASFVAIPGCVSDATVTIFYPHGHTETLVESPDEHAHRMRLVAERDLKSLMEDLDLVFLTERPSRLTKWHDK